MPEAVKISFDSEGMNQEMNPKPNDIPHRISELMLMISRIRGGKILTLLISDKEEPFVIDMSEEGYIGYEKDHEILFRTKLVSAFNISGILIIRQFLHIKVQRTLPNGEILWIPRKNVYGINIENGTWTPISKTALKQAYSADHKTGIPITPEKDVLFRDFPV